MAVPKSDIERAFNALRDKQKAYTKFWRYYDGPQPLVYSTRRLREIFGSIDARFTENWCAVVIDATHDKINLQRFSIENDDPGTKLLTEIWTRNQMQLDSDDAHKGALVCGEAFVIAWKDPEDAGQVECYYNAPEMCHIFYRPDKPRIKKYAAKWWVGEEDDRLYITLYYPGRFEYWMSRVAANQVEKGTNFVKYLEDQPNETGKVPVFHIRRERRAIRSELANIIEPQDAINKLVADMMVTGEFGAFKQRYIISNADNIGDLKNAPNLVWDIPAATKEEQPTQVGELNPSDPSTYLSAIERTSRAIGIISRTPKHYFFSQGGDPSGEALIAMETPLNNKVKSYIERFEVAWQEAAAYLMELSGNPVDALKIKPIFDEPETIQPLTQSIIRTNEHTAGIPLKTSLRWEGLSEEEIAQVEQDATEERTAEDARSNQSAKTEVAKRIQERRAAAEAGT